MPPTCQQLKIEALTGLSSLADLTYLKVNPWCLPKTCGSFSLIHPTNGTGSRSQLPSLTLLSVKLHQQVLMGLPSKQTHLGETCSRRARKSPRRQHDISKWHVLTAHLNGKASKQDPCFSSHQESMQRIYSPLKPLRNETFIFILTVKVTLIAFSATNVLTQRKFTFMDFSGSV